MTIYKNSNQQINDVITANSVKLFSVVNNKLEPATNYDKAIHAEFKAAAITRLAFHEASKSN